jgi:hypothetical protein
MLLRKHKVLEITIQNVLKTSGWHLLTSVL